MPDHASRAGIACAAVLHFQARGMHGMAMSADAIIDKLQKVFPTKIIYEEQYIKQAGVSLSFEIHKQAKACQQTYGISFISAELCRKLEKS